MYALLQFLANTLSFWGVVKIFAVRAAVAIIKSLSVH
jgi:hypothetical protein